MVGDGWGLSPLFFFFFITVLLLLSTTKLSESAAVGPIKNSQCTSFPTPADCPPSTCATLLASAVTKCSSNGGGVISLGPGTFEFEDSSSNSSTNLGQPLFNLVNISNVTITGAPLSESLATTIFLLHGLHGVFSLSNCHSFSLANVSLTLARPPVTLGTTVAVADNNFTVRVTDDSLFPFPQQERITGNKELREGTMGWVYFFRFVLL